MAAGDIPPDTTTSNVASATDELTNSFNRNDEAGKRASETLGIFDKIGTYSKAMLEGLNIRLREAGVNLSDLSNPATIATSKFGLLATAVVGATDSFTNLQNVDIGNLSTFSSQIEDVMKILQAPGTLGGEAKKAALETLRNSLLALGRPAAEVNAVLEKGGKILSDYAANVLKNADNGLRMQNAIIQLSARTGHLGDVFSSTQNKLGDMNNMLAEQSSALDLAGKNTGLAAEQLNQYWAILGDVPGALEDMTRKAEGSEKSTNILSNTILVAMGSGRKYADVVQDMRKAVIDYGLSTSQALNFTARISDVSNRFKAPMEAVRSAVLSTAEAFKSFADSGDASARQSEGFANIMANYIGALKDTKLSAQGAVELITNMTTSIKSLSVEQKAFLSAQTGGPGGLMGAFQIDKDLREGKLDKVFDRVRQQMQQQMGRIVTLDEAATSPAAAMQMEKQVQILRQGPLGTFAKTDQDAYRILEAFQKRQTGMMSPAELSNKIVDEQMKRGAQVKNLSNTPISEFRNMLQGIRYSVNIANLSTVQRAFTAETGVRVAATETETQRIMRQGLKTETPMGTSNSLEALTARNMRQMEDWFKKLPKTMQASFEGLHQAIGSGDPQKVQLERQNLLTAIQFQKNTPQGRLKEQALSNMPRMETQSRKDVATKDAFSDLDITSPNFGTVAIGAPGTTTAPSEMVRNAARRGTATTMTTGATPAIESVRTTAAPGIPAEMNFKVNVNAICTVCGHKVEDHGQTDSVSAWARKLPP